MNLIPDFASLLETRFVLHRMNDSKSFLKTFGFLGLDFIISALLIVGSILIFIFILVFPEEFISIYFQLLNEAINFSRKLAKEQNLKNILFIRCDYMFLPFKNSSIP